MWLIFLATVKVEFVLATTYVGGGERGPMHQVTARLAQPAQAPVEVVFSDSRRVIWKKPLTMRISKGGRSATVNVPASRLGSVPTTVKVVCAGKAKFVTLSSRRAK